MAEIERSQVALHASQTRVKELESGGGVMQKGKESVGADVAAAE